MTTPMANQVKSCSSRISAAKLAASVIEYLWAGERIWPTSTITHRVNSKLAGTKKAQISIQWSNENLNKKFIIYTHQNEKIECPNSYTAKKLFVLWVDLVEYDIKANKKLI
jgi:hypothetical protein